MNGNMKTLLVVPLGCGTAYRMDCPLYMTLRVALQQAAKNVEFAYSEPFLKIYQGLTPVPFEKSSRLLDVPLQTDTLVQELEHRIDRDREAWEWPFPL